MKHESVPAVEREASFENNEQVARTKEVIAEMKALNVPEADRVQRDRFRSLHQELDELMKELPWHVCVKEGFPWDPRLEMTKEQVANSNRAPKEVAA